MHKLGLRKNKEEGEEVVDIFEPQYVLFIFRIFDSIEGQRTIKKKDSLIASIERMESDVLTQWSTDVTKIIHTNTLEYLLKKTEKGLLALNFDESVSILFAVFFSSSYFPKNTKGHTKGHTKIV